MPVGGGDVEGLAGNFGASEIRNQMLGDIAGTRRRAQRHQSCADGEAEDSEGGGHRQRAAVEPRAAWPRKRDDRCGLGSVCLKRRSRRSGRRQRRDSFGKRLRGRFTRRVATDRVTQLGETPILGGESRVGAHLALERERAHGVEFAVERSVKSERRSPTSRSVMP